MIEDDFRAMHNKWIKGREEFYNHHFEHKFVNTTRKKSLNYVNDFKSHQLDTLYEIEHHGLPYTISNQSFGKKPCDTLYMKGNACIAVMFWKPRKTPHTFIHIYIDDFLNLIGRSEKKSFKEEELMEVGTVYVLVDK